MALLTLSHVEFKSGLRHDLDFLAAKAHAVGTRVLWDLSHSVGAVPIRLGDADLAVGCAYKYLNGGPGAPAFLYVRRDLQEGLRSPIQGWFGQGNAFEFGIEYVPAPGIERFLAGTPPILSLAAIEPGVDLLLEAGMDRVGAKAAAQTAFVIGDGRRAGPGGRDAARSCPAGIARGPAAPGGVAYRPRRSSRNAG